MLGACGQAAPLPKCQRKVGPSGAPAPMLNCCCMIILHTPNLFRDIFNLAWGQKTLLHRTIGEGVQRPRAAGLHTLATSVKLHVHVPIFGGRSEVPTLYNTTD